MRKARRRRARRRHRQPRARRRASAASSCCPGRRSTSRSSARSRRKPLARIKKISGANLHRNWVMIPHVTNHDDADITDLEAFRVQINKENEKSGVQGQHARVHDQGGGGDAQEVSRVQRLARRRQPDPEEVLPHRLRRRHAARTGGAGDPRRRPRRASSEIAKEMGDLAKLARDGKLKPDQMQGGTFTISSLGGIGGTYFTPIINAPEVAILGVCRSLWKQVSADGKTSSWRFILPLSLSWDHRVIDGAAAARFNAYFASAPGRPAARADVKGETTMATIEVKVPDIGDFKDVPVIEMLVKPGEAIKTEQALVTLESDKATMDVPSPLDGVVKEIAGQGRRQGLRGRGAPHRGDRGRAGRRRAPREGEGRRSLDRRGRAGRRLRRRVGRLRDGRGARPRHRRLQGRPGHRGVREAGRHDQA